MPILWVVMDIAYHELNLAHKRKKCGCQPWGIHPDDTIETTKIAVGGGPFAWMDVLF
ncbi:hypothetical protein J2S04_002354 [Alicyclobacillus tengchongensis]|uniref:Uncharacterized protein n=1 Tax=Alicyclobacillus tolerans TaxID=90970 RepID=A0ABT9LZ15_9BACL|nr:hypothetical protein [Alicyclobacillus tengchongensis]